MKALSQVRIAELLVPYGVRAAPALCEQIARYIDLLLVWNGKISLTTVVDPEEIVRFHFGESFFGATASGILGGRLADLGSGAGFPGLPLKMLVPALSVELIESNAKKAAFLGEACRRLHLERAHVTKNRFEGTGGEGKFAIVTSRALGLFDEVLKWSRLNLESGGILLLWLNSADADRISASTDFFWKPAVRIPTTDDRYILEGSPRP